MIKSVSVTAVIQFYTQFKYISVQHNKECDLTTIELSKIDILSGQLKLRCLKQMKKDSTTRTSNVAGTSAFPAFNHLKLNRRNNLRKIAQVAQESYQTPVVHVHAAITHPAITRKLRRLNPAPKGKQQN
ncbi:hypothetical protein Mapa_014112 [Marchantia paleacea]|nr:hypothetical protein Mapa_014112 [Marchantia paleacea]